MNTKTGERGIRAVQCAALTMGFMWTEMRVLFESIPGLGGFFRNLM